jgi:hypothetical protein
LYPTEPSEEVRQGVKRLMRGVTSGRVLDIHVESIHFDDLATMVKWTRHAPGDHGLVARSEHVPQLVGKEARLVCTSQLVRVDASAEGQDDLLAVGLLARRNLKTKVAAVGEQGILGGFVDAGEARSAEDLASTLVSKICADETIGLGGEEVDEGEDNHIDLWLLAVVEKVELVWSLSLGMSDGEA